MWTFWVLSFVSSYITVPEILKALVYGIKWQLNSNLSSNVFPIVYSNYSISFTSGYLICVTKPSKSSPLIT